LSDEPQRILSRAPVDWRACVKRRGKDMTLLNVIAGCFDVSAETNSVKTDANRSPRREFEDPDQDQTSEDGDAVVAE